MIVVLALLLSGPIERPDDDRPVFWTFSDDRWYSDPQAAYRAAVLNDRLILSIDVFDNRLIPEGIGIESVEKLFQALYYSDRECKQLIEAIAPHDGEANWSRARFDELTLLEQRSVIAFLETLRAPDD